MKAPSESTQALLIKLAILGCVGVAALALGSWAHGGVVRGKATVAAPAAGTVSAAFPQKLVGAWSRKVTEADRKRTGGYGISTGVYIMTIKRNGSSEIRGPGISFPGRIVPVAPGRIRFVVGIPTPNLYRWSVSGRLLTLVKVRDSVADRVAAYVGVWRKK